MSVIPLEKSPYSFHFNILVYLGFWLYETSNPKINNAYVLYKTLMIVGGTILAVLLIVKFFMLFHDFRKLTWNLCITSMFTWALIKNSYMIYRSKVLNGLRTKLHRRATLGKTPEDERLNRRSAKLLRKIEVLFYVTVAIIVPLWIIGWYFFESGERDLPVQVWIPFPVDMEDNLQFHLLFVTAAGLGTLSVVFVIAMELAMFTILIQISREYDRLIKDFRNINKLYEGCRAGYGRVRMPRREVNPYLRECKIRVVLKELSIRQQELIQFTRDFELSYSFTLLLQFFGGGGLFVVCAALAIVEYDNLSINVIYELCYLFIILMDMFLLSWFATRIRSQCYKIGDEAYSVFWYRMEIDIQKNICMIIKRSQSPPKITSGKFVEIDLHAFMHLVRNIYSWLTLLEQLAFKTD